MINQIVKEELKQLLIQLDYRIYEHSYGLHWIKVDPDLPLKSAYKIFGDVTLAILFNQLYFEEVKPEEEMSYAYELLTKLIDAEEVIVKKYYLHNLPVIPFITGFEIHIKYSKLVPSFDTIKKVEKDEKYYVLSYDNVIEVCKEIGDDFDCEVTWGNGYDIYSILISWLNKLGFAVVPREEVKKFLDLARS